MSQLQKIIVLCIISLVVIGGIIFLSARSANAPSSTNEPAAQNTNAPTNNANNVATTSGGNDAGMEFPTSDANTSSTSSNTSPEAKVFNVTGKNYEFSVKEIHVNKGDTVTINFSSTSGFHDWTIDEFNAHTKRVQTGGSSSVTFVADKVGTFEYYCSVGSHRALGMVGKLIVE